MLRRPSLNDEAIFRTERRGLLTTAACTASVFSGIRTDNTRPLGFFFFQSQTSLFKVTNPHVYCVCRRNLTAGRNLIVNFKFSRFSAPPCNITEKRATIGDMTLISLSLHQLLLHIKFQLLDDEVLRKSTF
jgi:hypothetical protein